MNNNDIVPGFDNETCEGLDIALGRIGELEGGLLLSLDGHLDSQISECFTRRVTRAIDAGFMRLVFDMQELDYTNDFRAGSFTAFLKPVKPRGGDIVLIRIEPKVFEVFQLLGFSQFFNIRDTLQEAIAFFTSAGTPRTPPVFPCVFRCPICSHKVRAAKSGRFRCKECRTILAVDPAGQVFLG